MTDWSKTSIKFIDVTVSIAEGIIETGLHVKSTDNHQYVLSSSYHPFYSKKGIPYSPALRLNRICSNNKFFDKRWNDLDKYLLERGYSKKTIRKLILGTRAIPKSVLLEKANNQEKQNKITFNITYHPVFLNVREILEEVHVILASDNGHKKVFLDVPMIVLKTYLKVHLVR